MQELRKYSYCKANIILAVIQAAVFAVCLVSGDKIYTAGECVTNLVIEGQQYWRLFTSIFLHAGAFITAAHTAQAGMDICAAYVDDLAGMTCRFRTPYKRIDKEFRRAVFIRTSH